MDVVIRCGHHLPCRSTLFTNSVSSEEIAGSPTPASQAVATPTTRGGHLALVGLTDDVQWSRRRREVGRAGAQASRSAGRQYLTAAGPRPAAGVSTRPPRSPPPRRARRLPIGCQSPFHSPPFPNTALRPGGQVDRRQALIAVFSSLLATLMRRGLAFSATGMVNRRTPLL